MSVCSDTFWPFRFVIGPYGAVVVNKIGQMVLHQIFAGDPEVDRVPELELSFHQLKGFLLDGAVLGIFGVFEKDVVPHFWGELFWFDAERIGFVTSVS